MTEAVVETTGRGRPRPTETIERDQKVLAALDVPRTKAQLVEMTALGPNQVYLSLYRLGRDGLVERARGEGSSHLWRKTEPTAG